MPIRLGRGVAILVALLASSQAGLLAQSAASQSPQLEIAGVTVSGTLRTRLESWDWFGTNPSGTYTYPGTLLRIGLGRAEPTRDWLVELAVPFLLALPEQPAGAAEGLGASYSNANDRSTHAAALFVKQAFVRFTNLGGVTGQSLKVGRMEFFDGAEVSPRHGTLAAVKRDRIALRLLGNFGFTHVGRSLDGVQYAFNRPQWNVTLVAGRPTAGVFQVDGWRELAINVFYSAVTRQVGGGERAGEWRVFAFGYRDYRGAVVKTDNRPLVARRADAADLNLGTFGGHYLHAIETGSATIDFLLWGAVQTGSWGDLTHRAAAYAAEGGWQPKVALGPWVRGGFNYASGDSDPADATHGTFFQALPTARLYARFPFFNMMNTADAFVELILRPSARLTVRADVHSLSLADRHDLWYQGGGAFQPETFGYVGQQSGGRSGLATLYDASADVAVAPRVQLGFYYGYAVGGPVPRATYLEKSNAAFGYVELLLRW
jgi:hypothetical protein